MFVPENNEPGSSMAIVEALSRSGCVAMLAFFVISGLPVATAVAAAEVDCNADVTGSGDEPKVRARRRPGRAVQPECVEQSGQDVEPAVPEIERATAPASEQPAALSAATRRPVTPGMPRPRKRDFEELAVFPDRWRIVENLGYTERWYDPYNRNVLKADRPVHGEWFFNLGLLSDTVFESRDVPTPVGVQSTANAGSLDVFGDSAQTLLNENIAVELVYYKGDTVFRPPDYEFRFTPVFNYNRTELEEALGVNVVPREGKSRNDYHIGIQAAFVDVHLRNVSDRYDFDSVRVGVQPFSSDFRGFLFQDNQLGIRLFGTRSNNRYQYNLGWYRRLEKDTNSGLNDVQESLRDDDIFFANIYRQDFPALGFTSQLTGIYNRNREDRELFFDNNGFIARPASLGTELLRDYDVGYLGYNGDGHFGRLNLTTSIYYAYGEESSGTFTNRKADIRSLFAAAEASMDFDWIRIRASALYGSGDDDPFDDESNGFDAIFENPQFAGADTSYWIRQAVPLIGGGRVSLSGRNGVLNSLRSSKELGQSNFTNPGVVLLGAGVDLDLSPELRLSLNLNQIRFDRTEVLEVARNQGSIDATIGTDISAAIIYRPFMSQNIVLRLSYATLLPGQGFKDLYGDEQPFSLLANIILAY